MKLLDRISFLNEDITDSNLTEKDLDFWFAKLKKEHPRSYYYDVIYDLVYSIKGEAESGHGLYKLFGENVPVESVPRSAFFNKSSHEKQWGFEFVDNLVDKGFLKKRDVGTRKNSTKFEYYDLKTSV